MASVARAFSTSDWLGKNGKRRPRMQASDVRGGIGWGCQGPGPVPVPPRDLCSAARVTAERERESPSHRRDRLQSCRIRLARERGRLDRLFFEAKSGRQANHTPGPSDNGRPQQAFRPNERRRPSLSCELLSQTHASWQQPHFPPRSRSPTFHHLPHTLTTHTLARATAASACGQRDSKLHAMHQAWPSPPLPNQPSTFGQLTARPARLLLVLARPRTPRVL